MQISDVVVWGNVHLRSEKTVANDRDWGTEAKGGQDRRKIVLNRVGSYLCY